MPLKPINTDARTDYTGCELKIIIVNEESIQEISDWARVEYSYAKDYWKNKNYLKILLEISKMKCENCDGLFVCCGERLFSYEELDKFADELILNDESIPNGYAPEGGYNENDFGCELKRRVFRRDSIESLAKWALEIFIEMDYGTLYGMDDKDLKNALLNLAAMIEDPKSKMTYEELDQLADEMILGRDIELK